MRPVTSQSFDCPLSCWGTSSCLPLPILSLPLPSSSLSLCSMCVCAAKGGRKGEERFQKGERERRILFKQEREWTKGEKSQPFFFFLSPFLGRRKNPPLSFFPPLHLSERCPEFFFSPRLPPPPPSSLLLSIWFEVLYWWRREEELEREEGHQGLPSNIWMVCLSGVSVSLSLSLSFSHSE